ncbi:MAG: hypothetical protein P1V51_21810 [Deltaproteobacteria bacterium]|nr:hypothetical protein [Deltaproteobacteria bacterium]
MAPPLEEGARALASLVIDRSLATPAEALLPPDLLARVVLTSLREADAERLRESLEEGLERHRGRLQEVAAKRGDEPLHALLPAGAGKPLAALAAEAPMPERETLATLLDHPAMRDILRAVLVDTLSGFATKAGALLSEASKLPGASRIPGSGRLSGVLGVAKGVGSALVDELSRKLEGRVGPFVDEALSRAVKVGLDAMSDPARAASLREWRRSTAGAVLDLPLELAVREAGRLDLSALSRALTGLVLQVARWEEAEEKLTELLRVSGGERWAMPLGELLEAEGIQAASWRSEVEAHLAGHLADLLASEEWAAWLGKHGPGA